MAKHQNPEPARLVEEGVEKGLEGTRPSLILWEPKRGEDRSDGIRKSDEHDNLHEGSCHHTCKH